MHSGSRFTPSVVPPWRHKVWWWMSQSPKRTGEPAHGRWGQRLSAVGLAHTVVVQPVTKRRQVAEHDQLGGASSAWRDRRGGAGRRHVRSGGRCRGPCARTCRPTSPPLARRVRAHAWPIRCVPDRRAGSRHERWRRHVQPTPSPPPTRHEALGHRRAHRRSLSDHVGLMTRALTSGRGQLPTGPRQRRRPGRASTATGGRRRRWS